MRQVDLVEELSLRIQCDPVSQAPPFNTKALIIKSANDSYHSPQWQVVMTRSANNGDNLDIQLRSPSSYSRVPTTFRSVNIVYHQRRIASVPLSEAAFSNWGELKLSFPVEKALNGSKYEFDIILSTQPQLLESSSLLTSPSFLKYTKPLISVVGKDSSSSSPPPPLKRLDQSQIMMKMFLRDRFSVDVQFLIYPTNEQGPESARLPGLWAHRLVMSRYPAFAALIREATSEATCHANTCPIEPLTIPVYGFSLAAFSCLLYFLYTGNVQLMTRPDLFALSEIDATEVFTMHDCAPIETDTVMVGHQYLTDVHPSIELSCKPAVEWVLDEATAASYWPVRGVTCRELYVIAKHFGITDLQEMCLEGMAELIDASNVIEMLFEFGCSSAMVRETGLRFVNDNLSVLFAEGQDPFVAYRGRDECYLIMVEIMRSFTKSLQIGGHAN
ncbi:hypothetical protein BGW39_000618 [Mortierella sp. 14UC]|nr:hypothetical protein BGW39_000618 [Mortierella sp. 14UC]